MSQEEKAAIVGRIVIEESESKRQVATLEAKLFFMGEAMAGVYGSIVRICNKAVDPVALIPKDIESLPDRHEVLSLYNELIAEKERCASLTERRKKALGE